MDYDAADAREIQAYNEAKIKALDVIIPLIKNPVLTGALSVARESLNQQNTNLDKMMDARKRRR